MIVPDTNLLIYAYDTGSPHHTAAACWWTDCMTGAEEIGLPIVVVFGFVRLVTHPRVFRQPMTAAAAAGRVRSWLAWRHVRILQPADSHVESVLSLLESAGTAGNLTTDAQIAAVARQERAVLHTNDTDFMRFSGLQWFNPLTGKGGTA